MKKFLSILLALAVGFTFTFGSAMSAFAATPSGTPADEYTNNQNTLTKEYNDCIATLAAKYTETVTSGSTTVKVTVDKSVYEKIAKEVYDTYMSVLEAQKAAIDADTSGATNYDTALSGSQYGDLAGKKFTDVDTQAEFNELVLSTGASKPYFNKTMELAFDSYKEEVKAELNKINLALYADKEMTDAHYNAAASVGAASPVTTGNLYKVTYKQFATELRDDAIDAVNKTYIAQLTAANENTRIPEAYKAVHDQLALLETAANTETISYKDADGNTVYVSYEIANGKKVPTIKDLEAGAITDEAKEAALKAIVDSKAAAYISANTATASDAKKLAAAFKEVMYSRIENEALDSFTTTALGDKIPEVDDSQDFNKIKGYYTALETEAATLKVTVDATGALLYDATIIDKNLADGKVELYKTGSTATTYDLKKDAKVSEQSLDWQKEVKIAALKKEMKAKLFAVNGDANYYALEQTKVEAKYQAVIDKINAATTKDQLNALPNTVSVTGISDKAAVTTSIKALTQFATNKAKLVKYVDLLNGDTKPWEAGYRTIMSEDVMADFYATNNARTNAEVAALYDAAKAECDKLPTKGEIAAAKKAVEDTINALPSYITLDNKEAVEAAFKAVTELDDNYGVAPSNAAKLTNAVQQLKNAVTAKLDADVKALPAKPTAADKATVDALLAEIEAYETSDMYKAGSTYATYAKKADVEKVAEKVRAAALNDVITAIANLPADATEAQVEAAKALYDAFVKDYTDAEEPYKAAAMVTNYDKLAYLEAKIKEANKFTNDDAKAYVQDLAIAVRTAKSGKKVKVTVNADVQKLVDNGYTVTYKFYKSTKKGSGYKNTVNKTTNTYTNTNPVKGKNYYKVKLVVKNADGAVVATTPLTQCKYGVRTIK